MSAFKLFVSETEEAKESERDKVRALHHTIILLTSENTPRSQTLNGTWLTSH